jgi:hypothetical protein
MWLELMFRIWEFQFRFRSWDYIYW